MKIRHKLVILLVVLLVTLNSVIAFLIYKRARQEFTREVREKAKLIAVELETTRNYLASSLKASKIGITEQTKFFIPAVSGHAIGVKFAEKTGYIIKQTSVRYRNLFNKPDPFEEKVLKKMEEDHNLVEYWGGDIVDGKRVERYLYALYVKEECLLCHGAKEQSPEFIRNNYDAGYDYKVGELRGAISVVIPKEIAEQRFAANFIFFITVGSISIVLIVTIIFLTTGKFMKPIEEKSANLQHAVLALERANKMKSEFLANMSHELRTPLNAIIGFAEVLRDKISGDLNDEQLDFVSDIHSSGLHLLQMINDILDLSKVEAGRMELQYEIFPVHEAIEDEDRCCG